MRMPAKTARRPETTKRLPTSFRLPADLRQQLHDEAIRQDRSVSNLVVHLLRQGLASLSR